MGRDTFVVRTRHERFPPSLKIAEAVEDIDRNLHDNRDVWVDLELRKAGSWLSTLYGLSKTFLSLINFSVIDNN
jgi:hypothetical protein